MNARRLALGLCLLLVPTAAWAHPWIDSLRSLKSDGRYLELRIQMKQQIGRQKLSPQDFKELRSLIYQTPEVGLDLLYQWDRVERSLSKANPTSFDKMLVEADRLSLSRQFRQAALEYARVARQSKEDLKLLQASGDDAAWEQARIFYPYVLHDLARALYGAGDFEGALKVYGWLPVAYPRMRIALLEKMWAAIRSGNAPHAIGVWYSIRSPFFSEFVAPEEFLVAIYALQALCLKDEATKVYEQMKKMDFTRFTNEQLFRIWVKKDYETLVLWNLIESGSRGLLDARAEKERKNIYGHLRKDFAVEYNDIQKSYTKLKAIGFLANMPETQRKLQKLAPLGDRESYFARGLEVWPHTGGEYWADEIGSHVYMGKSGCK